MRATIFGIAFAFTLSPAIAQGWQDSLTTRPDGPTLQCWISEEEMAEPSRAMLMRGTARSDYRGHIAKEWQFTLAGDDIVFVHGSPVEALYSDPASSLIVISMFDAVQARAAGSGVAGNAAARAAGVMATIMGLNTRAFVIDFETPSVTMVTHHDNGSRITDMVQAKCL